MGWFFIVHRQVMNASTRRCLIGKFQQEVTWKTKTQMEDIKIFLLETVCGNVDWIYQTCDTELFVSCVISGLCRGVN